MMRTIFFILLICPLFAQSQMFGYFPQIDNTLDTISAGKISFLFSFRKLRTNYTGYCIRARRVDNNAQADVKFDALGKMSDTSVCIVAVVGTSGYTVGQQLTYATFISGTTARATIWYDQGGNSRNASQSATAAQPQIIGTQNGLYYLKYTTIENLVCPYASNIALTPGSTGVLGVNGTLFMVCTPSVNVTPINSFGYTGTATNTRWSTHINWGADGNLYFDAGELCCATVRYFSNNVNAGLWKQYSFQRYNTNKLVRISGSQKMNSAGNADSYDATNTAFGIGNTNTSTTNGHNGLIGEVLLFNYGIAINEMVSIENNQIRIWAAY